MLNALHHHFTSSGTFSGSREGPVVGLAGWLTLGTLFLAGGYFAFVYLLAGR